MSWALAGKAVGMVAGLATTMALTRSLGLEAFGNYRAVLAYVTVLSAAGDLGLYMALLRELPRRDDPGAVIGAALSLRLVATGGTLVLAALVTLALPTAPGLGVAMFVGAAYFTAYQGAELLVAVFQHRLRQSLQTAAETAGALALLGLTLVAALAGAGWEVMLGVLAVSSTVTLALMWRWAARIAPFRLRFDLKEWRALVRFGLPMGVSHALGLAMLRGDSLLLALVQPAQALGLYGVPSKVFELATTAPFLFGGLMMAVFVQAAEARDAAGLRRALDEALVAMAALGGGAVAVCAVFPERIVVLIAGPDFADAWRSMALLGPAIAFAGLAMMARFALVAQHRQGEALKIDAIGAATAVVAFGLLIPALSHVGAAIGKTLVELVLAVGLAFAVRRTLGPSRAWPRFLRIALAAAAAAAAMAGLKAATWWGLALVGGGALYALALFALGVAPPWLRLRGRAGSASVNG